MALVIACNCSEKLIRFLLYSYKQILIDFLNFRIKLIKGEIYGGTKWI